MAIQEATEIRLSADERAVLAAWTRASSTEQRLVERARIVLLAADGLASRAIGREVGCARGGVSKWRGRVAEDRLDGRAHAPRAGGPQTHRAVADRGSPALLGRPPPRGAARSHG